MFLYDSSTYCRFLGSWRAVDGCCLSGSTWAVRASCCTMHELFCVPTGRAVDDAARGVLHDGVALHAVVVNQVSCASRCACVRSLINSAADAAPLITPDLFLPPPPSPHRRILFQCSAAVRLQKVRTFRRTVPYRRLFVPFVCYNQPDG